MKYLAAVLLLAAAGWAAIPCQAHAQDTMTAQSAHTGQREATLDELLNFHYGITDSVAFEARYAQLRNAVINHDATAVAHMFTFPARFNVNGVVTTCHNEAEFLGRYGDLITPSVVDAFVGTPGLDKAILRDSGIGVGNGAFWFIPVNGKLHLVAVNNKH